MSEYSYTAELSLDSRYSIQLTLQEIASSAYIETNSTSIKYALTATKKSGTGYYDEGANAPVKLVIGSQTIIDQKISFDFRGSSPKTITIASGTTNEIEHETDGSKSINVIAYFKMPTGQGEATINKNIALSVIPRATNAVNVNCEVESQKIIALQPYVATFTHSVKVVFGSISKYINASGNLQDSEVKLTNPTITFNVPTSFYGQFTGQNQSQNNGIEVRTYNGNTQIGNTQYGKLTVSCNETKCRPSISGTVTDSNTTTSALTGNINKLVKYYSTAYLSLTLNPTSTSGDSNTTITSRSVDGNTFSGTTYSITNATKSSFNVTLTNSRGYSNTVTVSASGGLVDYFKPKVIAEFSRTSQTADTVQVKYSVDIFNGSFGSQTNKVTVKAQVYENDAWTDINTLNTDSTTDISTTTVTLSGSYVYTSNFNFRIVATDLLDTTYVAQLVTAGVPNFSHGKGWFQHHTPVYLQDNTCLDTTYVDKGAISSGASWKSITEQGLYNNSNAMADRPSGSSAYGILQVTKRPATGGTNYLHYLYIDADNRMFSNMIWAGVEIGWKKLVNPNDFEIQRVTIATAKSGYTILDQVIYKQGKHYFGTLIVKKNSGVFNTTQEDVASLSITIENQINSGCFLSGSLWSTHTVGYLYIFNNGILVADFRQTNTMMIAKIPIDVVAK